MSFKIKSRWLNRTQENADTPNPLEEKSVKEEKSSDSQSHCPEFTKIAENVFIGEGSKPRSKGSKESKRMLCDCSTSAEERLDGNVACGEECLNRILFIECGPKCYCGEHCTNNRFQKRSYANVVPFPAGQKGWGLQTLEDLKKGQFVIEYVGEVLNASAFRHRMKRYGRDASHKHHYFMALRNDEVIDATEKGNVSRFINHSCNPNCETQKWTVNGALRIGFFTKGDISAGSEITFDYQFERYGKEAQKCFCGAENCRGYIGGRASEEEKVATKEAIREQHAKEKRRKAQMEDIAMEKQLNELVSLGRLKTKGQVLEVSRLMVRGEEFHARMKLLDVLMNTEEVLLRVFLDYHGCWLIWSWMFDDENLDQISLCKLQKKLLQVLYKLPIPHRNMLEDSRVLKVVQRWADSTKAQSESEKISEDVAFVVGKLVDSVESSLSISGIGGSQSPASSSSSAHEDNHSSANETSETLGEETLLRNEIRMLSQGLLSGPWAQLKEYFKIPKRTDAVKSTTFSMKIDPLKSAARARLLARRSALAAPKQAAVMVRYNQNKAGRAVAKILGLSRSHSGSGSPPSVAQGKEARTPSSSSPFKSRLLDGATSTPKTPGELKAIQVPSKRTRPSRFDMKTPINGSATSLSGAFEGGILERRKEFEINAAAEIEQDEQRLMSLEFQMARESLVGPDEPEDDDMVLSPVESPVHMEVCSSANLGLQVTTSEGDGEAIQANLFADPCTYQYWWQDPASGTLVYAVNEVQMAAVSQGDWSVAPYFVYNANTGLIHEVNIKDIPAPPAAQDPVVSSSESGFASHISPPSIAPWENYSMTQDTTRGSSISQESLTPANTDAEDTVYLIPPANMTPRQQIEFLKKQIAKLEKKIEEDEKANAGPSITEPQAPEFVPLIDIPTPKVDPVVPSPQFEPLEAKPEVAPEPEVPTMVPPPKRLPANWKMAKDHEGNVYYYNIETRDSQWETPKMEDSTPAASETPKPSLEELMKSIKASTHKISSTTQDGASPAKKFRPETTTAAADTSSEVGKKQRDKFKSEMSNYVIKCLHPYQKSECKIGRICSSDDFKHLARKLSHTVLEKEMKRTSRMEDLRVTDSVKLKAKDYIKKYMKKIGPLYRRSISASGRTSASPNLLEID